MDIERRIEKIEQEVVEVRKYVNDISHVVARLEEDVQWIKIIGTWIIGLVSGVLGLSWWSFLM